MHEFRDYIIIALAMIEGSIGLNIFLIPNHITMGGVGGISSIVLTMASTTSGWLIMQPSVPLVPSSFLQKNGKSVTLLSTSKVIRN